MSEIINNSAQRKELLKHMILQLHEGVAPEAIKKTVTGSIKENAPIMKWLKLNRL